METRSDARGYDDKNYQTYTSATQAKPHSSNAVGSIKINSVKKRFQNKQWLFNLNNLEPQTSLPNLQ